MLKSVAIANVFNRTLDVCPLCDGSLRRRSLLRRRRRSLKSCILSHHTRESDANAFDDSEKNGATDGVVSHGLRTTTYSERATSTETA